jgi:ankyrin repeat protein
VEIVRWLLQNANPDVNAKNYQGKTPLTVAMERNQKEIVSLLKEHEAK